MVRHARRDEDPGGDLRAVEGTVAEVEITTDKPLVNGSLIVDDNTQDDLKSAGDNKLVAPGADQQGRHVSRGRDGFRARLVRLSDDYFIEARKDNPPTVSITVRVRMPRRIRSKKSRSPSTGKDDFGVMALDLHYSVNGGEEKVVSLLKRRASKTAEGTTADFARRF